MTLAGDRLFSWVIRGALVQVHETVVDPQNLATTIERLQSIMRFSSGSNAAIADLSFLYDLIVEPLAANLGGSNEPITIVADDALAGVPFAALFDRRRRKFLIESHPIRFAQSLDDARRVQSSADIADPLFVAIPEAELQGNGVLPDLPHSIEEIDSAAAGYPHPRRLTGSNADSADIVSALPRSDLFHFAGHAVFNDARPERSMLVVGPHGLTAAAIARLDLSRVRLVLLSACETMRATDRPSAGFANLADAFLAAGAGGVIGSGWPVRDDVASALTLEFHRSYRGSHDAVYALQAAQLSLLRSPIAAFRSPKAWAAFRYVGY